MFYIFKGIANLLMPPGIFLLILIVVAIFMAKAVRSYYFRRKDLMPPYILLIFLIFILYFFSSYIGEWIILRPLEKRFDPILEEELLLDSDEKSVILVLGGGIRRGTARGEEVGKTTLTRLYEGLNLHRSSGYPLAVTGGVAQRSKGSSEGEIMSRVLMDFDIDKDDIIVESKALNTWQNARYTSQILEELGYERIILVTSASHMRRSVYSFNKHWDYSLVEAPADYSLGSEVTLLDFLPNRFSLERTLRGLHEWVGLFWYLIRI